MKMRTSAARKTNRPGSEAGFTYVMVMALAAAMALSAMTLFELDSVAVRRDAEEELLFRGLALREAIRSYYIAGGRRQYPRSMDDLLLDHRFPWKLHLRQAYGDPMGEGWRIIPSADGGLEGVVSSSAERPLKRAAFPQGCESFEGAQSYRDWNFEFDAARGN